ncbi:hypothetical protein D3C81_2107960 [compost metagenome]
MLLLVLQRAAGQILITLLKSLHGLLGALLNHILRFIHLLFELHLDGDLLGYAGFGFLNILFHIPQELVQHFHRILSFVQQIIDRCHRQVTQSFKNSHC